MALILAIDTSCDETSAAVTDGRRVLSNVISSQIDLHKKYGGVFPSLAKRCHEERIDYVVEEALRRASIALKKEEQEGIEGQEGQEKNNSQFDNSIIGKLSAVAVTQGPGLAIALEVGIRKAKELVTNWKCEDRSERLEMKCEVGSEKPDNPKITSPTSTSSFPHLTSHLPLIAVNHLEGHIYSCLSQNHHGLPKREFLFPTLCLIVSGGHTELVIMKDIGNYTVIGATLDDACGEALDKAARILKLGYPGGPIIERLAEEYARKLMSLRGVINDEAIPRDSMRLLRGKAPRNDSSLYLFNQPLKEKTNLNFSYSGLKTQLLYLVQSLAEKDFNASLEKLAFSFQDACFEQIIRKASNAIKKYQPKSLVCGGGVIANKYLRKLLRDLAKQNSLPIYFPQNKKLITDNAAMIGVAAYFKMLRGEFVKDINGLDREPRLSL